MEKKDLTLDEIKRYDDSVLLYILKQNTVFDADQMKMYKDWLIEQAEKLEKLSQAFDQIDFEASEATTDDFYDYAKIILRK